MGRVSRIAKNKRKPGRCQFLGQFCIKDELSAKIALAGAAGKLGATRYFRCLHCGMFHTTRGKREANERPGHGTGRIRNGAVQADAEIGKRAKDGDRERPVQ